MDSNTNHEIQIKIPFETLIQIIRQLERNDLIQLHRLLNEMLFETSTYEEGFWSSELGKYIQQEADDAITHQKVRKALSVIKGSLAAEITAQREER